MSVAGMKTRTAVYTTAAFSRPGRVNGWCVRVPAGEAHAKTWGATRTLCGADCGTWPKFFDLSFFRVERDRCPVCTSAVLATSRLDAASTS